MARLGFEERLYSATKLVALMQSLANLGVAPHDALQGVDLSMDELHSPDARISLSQMLQALKSAVRLGHDAHLPYKLGLNNHVTAYGMYGYAMLCGVDFRRTMEFAVAYHQLAAPLTTITFTEEDRRGVWTIEPVLHPLIDAQFYRFLTELQFGIHVCLHRDLMGASFAPIKIAMTYAPATDFRLSPDLVGCPISFGEAANQLIFDAAWLDAKPTFGNRTTYAAVRTLCDELVAEMEIKAGVAGKIRRLLLQDIANRPTFSATARLLGTTTRTLRRQLRLQKTSFRELLDELRTHLALKYLKETAMTNDDIAFALGFSEAANFRHAFKRWTKQSPRQFRQQARAGALSCGLLVRRGSP
jgi:AraC-like DNA-binding protein